jgi:hypothetical protein
MEPTGERVVWQTSQHGRMGLGRACKEEETFMVNQLRDWNKENNIQNKIHIQF